MKIRLLALLLLTSFVGVVVAAEPSDHKMRLEVVRALRQATLAEYRRAEMMEEAARAIKDAMRMRDSIYDAEERQLLTDIEKAKTK